MAIVRRECPSERVLRLGLGDGLGLGLGPKGVPIREGIETTILFPIAKFSSLSPKGVPIREGIETPYSSSKESCPPCPKGVPIREGIETSHPVGGMDLSLVRRECPSERVLRL